MTDFKTLLEIVGIGDYNAALANSETFKLFDRDIPCLSLRSLIKAKRAANRQKDLEAVAELELLLAAAGEVAGNVDEEGRARTMPVTDDGSGAASSTTRSALTIVVTKDVPVEFTSAMQDDMRLHFGDVQIETRAVPGPFASFEWAIPTAVLVWIAEKYLGAMLVELGKDQYKRLSIPLSSVWHRFFGPKPELTYELTTGGPPKQTVLTHAFSVCSRTRYGGVVVLRFQPGISHEDFAAAQEMFIELLARHRSADAPDELTALSDAIAESSPLNPSRDRRKDILFFDTAERRLAIIDVVASSRRKTLVSRTLNAISPGGR